MTISRENKTLILSELRDKLKNSECVLLAHYSGVNVQDLENFRILSRNSGVEVKVIKNSLFRLANLKSEFFITLTSTPEFLDNILKFSKSWTFTPL